MRVKVTEHIVKKKFTVKKKSCQILFFSKLGSLDSSQNMQHLWKSYWNIDNTLFTDRKTISDTIYFSIQKNKSCQIFPKLVSLDSSQKMQQHLLKSYWNIVNTFCFTDRKPISDPIFEIFSYMALCIIFMYIFNHISKTWYVRAMVFIWSSSCFQGGSNELCFKKIGRVWNFLASTYIRDKIRRLYYYF